MAKGCERGNFVELSNNKFFASEIKRLIPCVIAGKDIPLDYVKSLYFRASNREAYKIKKNYNRVLLVDCCVIRKHLNKEREEYSMALQTERRDRDCLYGRLLATARKIEETVMRGQGGQNDSDIRITNAERYTTAFSKQPFKMWCIIYNRLNPYWKRLKPGQKIYFEKVLNSIILQFDDSDYEDDSRLGATYILGYRCQLDDFYNKNDNKNDENNENEQA